MGPQTSRMSGWANTWPRGRYHAPLARRQFNNVVQYVNSATSTHTTGEACKAAVEAYAASVLRPTAMCELLLNMRAPKCSWRTLLELYTLRKLEYHRTVPSGPYSRPICTERSFQARWKELVAPVQLDDHVATVLPKATGISWPFASWVTYILSRPGLVRSINRTFPLTFIVRGDAYPVATGNWTQVTISLANFDRLALSPAAAMGIVTQWAIRLQTSDFYGPSPPTPSTQAPHDRPPPPQYQTSGQVENGKIWNLGKRSTWGKA